MLDDVVMNITASRTNFYNPDVTCASKHNTFNNQSHIQWKQIKFNTGYFL